MPTIQVEGLGNIEFPDDMSEDDITKAIQGQLGNNEASEPDNRGMVQKFNDYVMKNDPMYLRTGANMYQNFLKGIPVIGNYMNADLPNQKEFTEEHPILAGGSKLAGELASTAPLAGLMAAKTAASGGKAAYTLGEEIAPKMFEGIKDTGSRGIQFLKDAAGQSSLFGSLGAADAAAQGGDTQDIKNKAILGAIGGAAGPATARALSPGVNISDDASKLLSAILGTTAGGKIMGMGEAVLGLLLGENPKSAQFVQKAIANKTMQAPEKQALLSNLSGQAGQVPVPKDQEQ